MKPRVRISHLFTLLIASIILTSINTGKANAIDEVRYTEIAHWAAVGASEDGPEITRFGEKPGIAIDNAGNIYLMLPSISQIKEFSPAGDFLERFSNFFFSHNSDEMAIGRDGIHYATGIGVSKLRFDGSKSYNFFSPGTIGNPIEALAMDNDGNIYLSIPETSAVKKYDSSGSLLSIFNILLPDRSGVYEKYIDVGKDGLIYVLDDNRRLIIVLNSDGTIRNRIDISAPEFSCEMRASDPDVEDESWGDRSAMAVDDYGYVYVYCSGGTRSIEKIRNDGHLVLKYTSPPQVKAMAIRDNNLYIVDDEKIVHKSALRMESPPVMTPRAPLLTPKTPLPRGGFPRF